VAVDLETTGDGPAASGIIEIGAVRVEGGRLGESFVTLVDPGRAIHPFVVRLTGITDAMVAGAPTIEEALPRFLASVHEAELLDPRCPAKHDVARAHLLFEHRPLSCGC